MKTMQIVAHTTGGIVKSAPAPVEEREYDSMKEFIKSAPGTEFLSFNLEDGWAMIPSSQIQYIEIILT